MSCRPKESNELGFEIQNSLDVFESGWVIEVEVASSTTRRREDRPVGVHEHDLARLRTLAVVDEFLLEFLLHCASTQRDYEDELDADGILGRIRELLNGQIPFSSSSRINSSTNRAPP